MFGWLTTQISRTKVKLPHHFSPLPFFSPLTSSSAEITVRTSSTPCAIAPNHTQIRAAAADPAKPASARGIARGGEGGEGTKLGDGAMDDAELRGVAGCLFHGPPPLAARRRLLRSASSFGSRQQRQRMWQQRQQDAEPTAKVPARRESVAERCGCNGAPNRRRRCWPWAR